MPNPDDKVTTEVWREAVWHRGGYLDSNKDDSRDRRDKEEEEEETDDDKGICLLKKGLKEN